MRLSTKWVTIIAAAFSTGAGYVHAAGPDVTRTKGPQAQAAFGSATNVIIGIVDSGIDDTHPALTGLDSLNRPRMVAEANFVTSEPSNTGDDVFGHGTAVAGLMISRDSTYFGIATDARYVNARVLDSNNNFTGDAPVINGVGFALTKGSDLLNMSLGYDNTAIDGSSKLSLMADYITYALRKPVVIAAGNNGARAPGSNPGPEPQGPGDSFNGFSVGATNTSYNQIASFSSYGPTGDGRLKPDIVAPGQFVNSANANWETEDDFLGTFRGTSFAAPNTAALMATQIGYGKAHNLSYDPLVLKSTLLNSAEKVNDIFGSAWAPNQSSTSGGVFMTTSPLNASAGAGQIDGQKLAQQYTAGRFASGGGMSIGWDLNTLAAATTKDYDIGSLAANSTLTVTLDWLRHVGTTDVNNNNAIDSGDTFTVITALTDLNLSVLCNGALIAQSKSTVDDVEHLFLNNLLSGAYTLRVSWFSGAVASEDYGIAWYGVVPEPTSLAWLLAAGALTLRGRRQRPSVMA